jgi:uncharacterized protein with von Willebrand factor type A (vWA) domain
MANKQTLGGVIHTYQKYDPIRFPSPASEPPDLVSAAFEHMLMFGELRELTEEELARAVRLDPRQFASLGPSIQALLELLRERKRKILSTYETRQVQHEAQARYQNAAANAQPPRRMRHAFKEAIELEQIYDLETLWYRAEDDEPRFAAQLVQLMEILGDKYQIDELAAKYTFSGKTPLAIPQAIEIKDELEKIDRLLKQLEEAAQTAQLGIIDLADLAEYAEPGDIENLNRLQQQIEEYLRELAKNQGLDRHGGRLRLTPKAYRLFQGRLLERIFSCLQAARSGRHAGPIVGEGAVELQTTKPYEFGDSITNMDLPASFVNALIRQGGAGLPVQLRPEDIVIHRTRNSPKCATAVLMDMSGSMRYDGLYVNVKRMGLALEGLIRREFPGDYLQFVEVYTFAKPRRPSELVTMLPKFPTLHAPVVRLKQDMSQLDVTELQIPQHFTNIQHGLQQARQLLSVQDTPNRQIILITDGLPTAHFEGQTLYLLYPPDPLTEQATLREGMLCRREGITINIFLLPTWAQSRADVQFAYRLAESTKGRVFFTAGRDLERYVIWDYVSRKREIVA